MVIYIEDIESIMIDVNYVYLNLEQLKLISAVHTWCFVLGEIDCPYKLHVLPDNMVDLVY